MTLTQIKPAGLSKPVDLADNERIRLGTGNDLQIYHNGSNSYVQDVGTGNLHLTSNGTAVSIDKGTSENMAVFNTDGAVELYHNGSKKFETQSTGIHVTGDVSITGDYLADDNERLKMGNGFDLQIYHDGTDSYIQNTTGTLRINNDGTDLVISTDNNIHIRTNGTEEAVKAIANGAVELYYDNVKTFATKAGGNTLYGTDATGNVSLGRFYFKQESGTVRALYDPNAQKFQHYDNTYATFGNGDDLKIYHDGNNSYIRENGTGSLYIDSNGNGVVLRGVQGEDSIVCNANGAVDLYYDNSKKLETFASGVRWTGQFQGPVAGDSIQWTGSSSNAFLLAMSDGSDLPANSSTGFNFHHWNGSAWKRTHHFGRDQLYMPDNVKLLLGTSNDLQIYHDGSNSVLADVGTGALVLKSNQIDFIDSSSTEFLARFFENSSVELYFDSGKKFETTTDGVNIAGNVLKFQGQANRVIKYRPGDNDMIYEGDAGDFYRQNLNDNRHEFFVGNSKKVSVTGDGLTFNADTAAANALDDYEEGTYTPTLTFASDDGNKVYANRGGSYTKIGRKVTVNININLSNRGTGSGLAKVSLPFTVGDRLANTAFEGGGFAYYFINLLSSVSNIMLQARENTATAELRGVTGSSSGSFSDFSYNFVSNSTELRLTVTYFI